MNHVQLALVSLVSLAAVAFLALWLSSAGRHAGHRSPTWIEVAIGTVTDFFDALGIGSFATSTSIFRALRLVPDELIPGTLNVGHAPAAIAEALIFVVVVAVDPALLAAMTAAAVLGAWLGAGVVVHLPRDRIQWGMGAALIVAGALFVAVNLHVFPGGGTALALHGWRLVLAVAINFVLGALMTVGVGIFGPCMLTLALLGMNPIASFPIMMASGALLQCVASERFLRTQRYAFGPAAGLALGGVPGVLLAAFVVKSLPVTALRWLVTLVVAYTALSLLRAARRGRRSQAH